MDSCCSLKDDWVFVAKHTRWVIWRCVKCGQYIRVDIRCTPPRSIEPISHDDIGN